MEANEEKQIVDNVSWENCPPELLLMIFEAMPASTLAVSMFVNRKWKRLVEYVLKHKNKWEEVVDTAIIDQGAQFKLKSNVSLGWQRMYYNHILWNHVHRADISLYQLKQALNYVRKVAVYRDSLIVVTKKNVRYYNVKCMNLLKTVEMQCVDFIENDHMIVMVLDNSDRYYKLELFKKSSVDDFNITRTNMCLVEKVMFYRVDANQCYVFNYRNNLIVYAIVYSNWAEVFTARFYGNPYESCAINVFDDEAYLMLKNGSILRVDMGGRCFRKVLHIKAPHIHRTQTCFCKIFHRFGFVFGVPEDERVGIERYTLFLNNVFIYKLPGLTCMEQHGDILFLGYLDGTIELLSPRDVTRTDPVRRFNIKEFTYNVRDTEIVAIDAYEDDGFHHLYIATHLEIFHLQITYPNCEDYMWKEYVNLASLIVNKSAEGLAFKNRTEKN